MLVAASPLSGIPLRYSFTQNCLPDTRYNAVIIALIESFTLHIYVALNIHKTLFSQHSIT